MEEVEDKLGVIPLTFPPEASKIKELLENESLLSLVKSTDLSGVINTLSDMGIISGLVSAILSDLSGAQKDMIEEFSEANRGKSFCFELLSTPTPPIAVEFVSLPGLVKVYTLTEEEVELRKLPYAGADVDTLFSFIASIISQSSFSIPQAIEKFIVQDKIIYKRWSGFPKIFMPFLKLSYPELRDLVARVVAKFTPLLNILPSLLGQNP